METFSITHYYGKLLSLKHNASNRHYEQNHLLWDAVRSPTSEQSRKMDRWVELLSRPTNHATDAPPSTPPIQFSETNCDSLQITEIKGVINNQKDRKVPQEGGMPLEAYRACLLIDKLFTLPFHLKWIIPICSFLGSRINRYMRTAERSTRLTSPVKIFDAWLLNTALVRAKGIFVVGGVVRIKSSHPGPTISFSIKRWFGLSILSFSLSQSNVNLRGP